MATFYTSAIAALVIAALAIFVNEFADRFDEELNACGLGTFKDGACECVHPYVGQHCETADCGYGRLINSLFESSAITTPHPDSDIGCACESQWWGYSCANCTSKYPSDCSGPCNDGYYGSRCDIMCKQGTASDATGYAHEQAGGIYNYYVDFHGICKRDGSVKCNIGRAGEHCEFECLNCEYGSCDLTDGSCNCFQGYYGELCNGTCPGRCSGNNGRCQEDGTCDCDAGFTGDDCSLECCIRDGGTPIGRVHGSCNPLGGCICDQDWSGPSCDCSDQFTCGGRGTCINDTGICGCEPEFQGAKCELCNDLRIGPFCQYERYQCPSFEEQNGEFVPVNTRGDYACKCKAGFRGAHCQECVASAYPKNGTEMCSFVIPASLCNRGTVKPTYQGTGLMCDCELNFDPEFDCASCKDKYFGEDCEIFCDVDCTNSGGVCETTGCVCPRSMSSVDGVCQFCGGDDSGQDCGSGECIQGRCICDPGYYGDNCQVSAPIADGKVCNGYQSSLYFMDANCETDAECLDTSQPIPDGTSVSLANQAVALQAQQFGREAETFCHRLDTPIALKDTEGCCVDANFDGKCDADKLLEFPCSGEVVSDICNQRNLEGEVNVFEWCTSIQRGCTKNGACADPVLCEDRCDDGMNSSEWIERWEWDHIQSMETLMNESWKFPIHFDDPFNVQQFYTSASLDDVCPAPTGYNFCRDALIPPDATVFNVTYKWVDEWKPMPSFHSCELDYHILKNVNGTYLYNFSQPIWAGNIEMVSDTTETAAFGRLGQNDQAYYGNTSAYIDSILLFGRGEVELIIYNYTTDDCVDLMKRSASHFVQCKEYAFYEFEYDWDDFCTWRDTVVGPGGFEQRCYDQSLVCAGCEFWQEGCENLPLESEYPYPMPPPCTPWDGFCEDYLNVTIKQTGTCAYTECACEGFGVGGRACDLQCAVPQFLNSESACGADLDPPMGQCRRDRGVIAFGFEQGRCECFNGGDPNLGCALVCTGEQDCSADRDTPFSFSARNCSLFADLVSFTVNADASDPDQDQVCLVNLRDSMCNYWRGRCECATPYTIFNTNEQPIYYNMGSFRVALMQGYDIEQYKPFTRYIQPGRSIISIVERDTLCFDSYVYPVIDSHVCVDSVSKRNTDVTIDEDNMRCKDYTESDCGKTRESDVVPVEGDCGADVLGQIPCLVYDEQPLNVLTKSNSVRKFTEKLGRCKQHDVCQASNKPVYPWTEPTFASVGVNPPVYKGVEDWYGKPRYSQAFTGCDSARDGSDVLDEDVCLGVGPFGSNQEHLSDFFTTCCRTMIDELLPNQCVGINVVEMYPIKEISDGICQGDFEPIETLEECILAVDMLGMDHNSQFFKPVVDLGSDMLDLKGCFRNLDVDPLTVNFNGFQGISYITSNANKVAICKKKGPLTSQSILKEFDCEGDCTAIGYNELMSEKFHGTSVTTNGDILQSCLAFDEEQVYYNEDTIPIHDQFNYLIWDLEGLKTNFGVEITTDLMNIRPNWFLDSGYVNENVVVSVYELSEDVSLDTSVTGDWTFVRDINMELKPDKAPVITVEGTCAGSYTAGGARPVLKYEHQAWDVKCDDAVGGILPALSTSDPLYSPNPAKECMNQCEAEGGFHLTPTFQCECAPCLSTSNNAGAGDNYNVYHIIEVNETEKNPLQILGDWVGDNGKRIHKNQRAELSGMECRDGGSFAHGHKYSLPLTQQQCIDELNTNQVCVEYRSEDQICNIYCLQTGSDCYNGADPNDPDSGLSVYPYGPTFGWDGTYVETEPPNTQAKTEVNLMYMYEPDYECSDDAPSYVFISEDVCPSSVYHPGDFELLGPERFWYTKDMRNDHTATGSDSFPVPPSFRHFRVDGKEECAVRCQAQGWDEMIVVYVYHEKIDPMYEGKDFQRLACMCKDFSLCDGNRVNMGAAGYQTLQSDLDDFGWFGGPSGWLNNKFESYKIVDVRLAEYDESEISMSCPEDYTMVESANEPFDDYYWRVTDMGSNSHSWDFVKQYPNLDGYFKLYNSYVPNLMTHKCSYKIRVEYNGIKTRFMKYQVFSTDKTYHSVKLKPLVTDTNVEFSDEKTGCIEEGHEITYYNFMQTNFTSKRYACKYRVLEFNSRCDYATLYSNDIMDPLQCSEACGSAFHIQNSQCYCAPFACVVRTADPSADAYIWEPDDCDFTSLGRVQCNNVYMWFNVVVGYDLHNCADFCKKQGASSFTVSGTTNCYCCKDDAQSVSVSPSSETFRFNTEFDSVERFVKVDDKSCETYGHRTIMDEEVCKRGAIEFGGTPTDIFDGRLYGICNEVLTYEPVRSVIECASKCSAFTVKYDHTWDSPWYCQLAAVLYDVDTTVVGECEEVCSRDHECKFFMIDTVCHIMSDCLLGEFGSVFPSSKKLETLQCGCSESAGANVDQCTLGFGEFLGWYQTVTTTGTALNIPQPADVIPRDLFDPSGNRREQDLDLVDIDNDGDLDIFMSTQIGFPVFGTGGATRYWENTGTVTSPEFTERFGVDNPLDNIGCSNMLNGGIPGGCSEDPSTCSIYSYAHSSACCWVRFPCYKAFGDVDGDGDIDVVFSRFRNLEYIEQNPSEPEYGSALTGQNLKDYYRNEGDASNPNFVHQTGANNPFDSIAFGNVASADTMWPVLHDLDNDGKVDLILTVFTSTVYADKHFYKNTGTVGNPVFTLTTGALDPLDTLSIGKNVWSIYDIDGDGQVELFGDSYLMYNWNGAAWVETIESQNHVLRFSSCRRSFGDLNGDGAVEVLAHRSFQDRIDLYENFGTATDPNWQRPMWPAATCSVYCEGHLGYRTYFQADATVECYCHDDTTPSASSKPYGLWTITHQTVESWNNIELTPRGCSLDKFTDEDIEIECEDCICLEGDGVYEAPFVTVDVGTCESNGYRSIGLRSVCFQGVAELGYDFGVLPAQYTSGLAYTEAGPLGCSWNDRIYFGDGSQDCSAQTCICQRRSLYLEVSGSTCNDADHYPIKTYHECEAAALELGKGSGISYQQPNAFNGCTYDSGTTTFLYNVGSFNEGSLPGGFAGTVLCRTQGYPNDDYVVIYDLNNIGGGTGGATVCAANGLIDVIDQDDCERAAVSMGLRTNGMHPVTLENDYDQTDLDSFELAHYRGCSHYISGFASFRNDNSLIDECDLHRPCLCRQTSSPTVSVKPWYPMPEPEKYIVQADSKYVIIDDGASCDTGFTIVSGGECETAKTFFPQLKYEPDCSRICKHEADQCDEDETCICASNETVVVFNSTAECVICGGGEEFDVRSSFFNENGNTRSCIYSGETSCSQTQTGWTQYIRDYTFYGNESSYVQSSNFTGYCSDVIDIEGDYDNMILSQVIMHCQRLCRTKPYFSVKRDECKCTSSCPLPVGADEYTTFTYVTDHDNRAMERNEFLTKWDNVDPNIECFTDLDHTERVSCQWISALKHFARGGSYRVGDCHYLAPGIGTGVNSQIPCSGHGFLTGGTCACDYAKNIELKDTGVGLSFELPSLRETPFRGKGCEIMCPGYDLNSMESVCSGHGRCEMDGRCACDQGYVGYKCHLECENELTDLTCSGHGVCNIIHAPVRPDMLETIQSLDCNRSTPEIIPLSRDSVIQTGSIIYHMFQQGSDLLVNTYRTGVDTIVSFSASTNVDYLVSINDGNVQGGIQNDPEIRVCRLSHLIKEFDGKPLSIIDVNGNFIINNMSSSGQVVLNAAAGTYTYFCTDNPELTGQLIIEECSATESRNATIDDFFIEGEAYRRSLGTDDPYPYMPCADTISVKREEAVHPLITTSTPDVYIDCALQSGFLGTAYTVVCAECQCSFSATAGHWTGYNCRTPALGYLGEDARSRCPGLVDNEPCNGRGSCYWGSTSGLGVDIATSSNCFCGNPGNDTNYSQAPRNSAGDILLHAESFGVPLYMDPIGTFEGNLTDCPEGLVPVDESECDYTKDGILTEVSAKIITDQEYILSENTCAGFDDTKTEVINRVSASGDLIIEGTGQQFKCAQACFGHYRFKANGKIGSAVKLAHSFSGTFEEKVHKCGFGCMNRERGIEGPLEYEDYSVMGFSISTEGECYCETEGAIILDLDWRHYEFVFPYREIDGGGLCFLNNKLLYSNIDDAVPSNPGLTPQDRVTACARKCQLYRYELVGGGYINSVGFSYMETNAQCYCETMTNDCTVSNPSYRRFDFDTFNIFKHTENAECRCGRDGGSECFSTLNLPELDFPTLLPSIFTFEGEKQVYYNFVCRKDGNKVCKPGPFEFTNFANNCECKFGWTGPLCETPRMMCILGGAEVDGDTCDCTANNIENLKQNPLGCCAYGLYWNQDRYSNFSPLQEFSEIADNVFYKDALTQVCKAPNRDAFQSPGEDDSDLMALRQHNYVATTTDHEVSAFMPCDGATLATLYKAVYKHTTAYTGWGSLESTEEVFIHGDKTLAHFSDYNAKMKCLDHCTTAPEFIDDKPSKSFVLHAYWKGNMDINDPNILGEVNDLPYIFRCKCLNKQAYIRDGYQSPNPNMYMPPVLGGYSLYRLKHVMKSDVYLAANGHCGFDTWDKGEFIESVKFLTGTAVYSGCRTTAYHEDWTVPEGETLEAADGNTYGVLPTVEPYDDYETKSECATRCSRGGLDAFWIQPAFEDDDGQTYTLCNCVNSGSFYEKNTAGDWVTTFKTGDSATDRDLCNTHSDSKFQACYDACFDRGFLYTSFPVSANTGIGSETPYQCRCYSVDDCQGFTADASWQTYKNRAPKIFDGQDNLNFHTLQEASAIGDLYDIVYPRHSADFQCVQTQNEVIRHVDQQNLRGIPDNSGERNEIGVPFSIKPQALRVKSTPKSVQYPGAMGQVGLTFQQCYAYCRDEKWNNPLINSFAYRPEYPTIEMVYAGESPGIKLPRCWGGCQTDADCAGNVPYVKCLDRATADPDYSLPIPGCEEPFNGFLQYGTPTINYISGGPPTPIGLCEGDCDSDADCDGNLKCFMRTAGQGAQPVPGCDNTGLDQAPITEDSDFCYDPGIEQQKVCGLSFTTDYNDQMRCECIEHDEEFVCEKYQARSEKGKCIGGIDLGAPLVQTDPFFIGDKTLECRARCLRRDEDTKAFYVKTTDQSCGCANDYCKLDGNTDYQVYDIAEPFGPSCDTVDGFLMETELGLYTEPFVKTTLSDTRPPNPLMCNIESYLHIGTIVDTGNCECPLYNFEPLYQSVDNPTWVQLNVDKKYRIDWDGSGPYKQMVTLGTGQTVASCKLLCEPNPDCNEIILESDGTCMSYTYNPSWHHSVPLASGKIVKVSDRFCEQHEFAKFCQNDICGQPGAGAAKLFDTLDECYDEVKASGGAHHKNRLLAWGEPRGYTGGVYQHEDKECLVSRQKSSTQGNPPLDEGGSWGWADSAMDQRTPEGLCTFSGSSPGVPSSSSGYPTVKSAFDGIYVPTYKILEDSALRVDLGAQRWQKQLQSSEVNRYCGIGEVVKYTETLPHRHANPHYCMQECRKELMIGSDEWILSRSQITDETFTCYCSSTLYDDCVLEGPSTFPQYKVFRYSTAYSTRERLMMPRDSQVQETRQCQCLGYHIFEGEAFSCPKDTFKKGGHCTSECEKCPQGQFSEMGSSVCERCPAGRVMQGDDCVKCLEGEFATQADNECQVCPMGQFNILSGQGSCTPCAAGKFDDDNQEGLNCDLCPQGYDTEGNRGQQECTQCAPGRYAPVESIGSCTLCTTGTYSQQTGQILETDCLNCGVGKHQNEYGQTSCKDCNGGRYINNPGRPNCATCPVGWYQGELGKTSCGECYPGYYTAEEGRWECVACDGGEFASSAKSSGCETCSSGQYSTSGSSSCATCPVGYYQEQAAQNSCSGCPGKISGVGGREYGYAAGHDPKLASTACDQIFDPSAYYDAAFNARAWNGDIKDNFDCVKKSRNAYRLRDGIFARSFCWLNKDWGKCGDAMNTQWSDKAGNNFWEEAYPSGSTFKWCIPKNLQALEFT